MSVPQLTVDDMRVVNDALAALLESSEASAVLLVDYGGFLLAEAGNTSTFDSTTLGALAAGSFAANQSIAALVNDKNFNSVYQQGDQFSLVVQSVDEHCLLVVIFQASLSVGLVKYFANTVATEIAARLKIARERNPDGLMDLSVMNLNDTSALFHRTGE